MCQHVTGLKCFGALIAAGAGVVINCLCRAGSGCLEILLIGILFGVAVNMTDCRLDYISADRTGLVCGFGSLFTGDMSLFVFLASADGTLMPVVCLVI